MRAALQSGARRASEVLVRGRQRGTGHDEMPRPSFFGSRKAPIFSRFSRSRCALPAVGNIRSVVGKNRSIMRKIISILGEIMSLAGTLR